MPSNKLARINDDIQYVVSQLLREVKDPRVQQGMVSVTRVETTGDLKFSKIWLSVYGMQDEKEFRKGMKSVAPWMRRELGNRMKIRNVPQLVFEVDHSIEYGAHIIDIINQLSAEQEPEVEE